MLRVAICAALALPAIGFPLVSSRGDGSSADAAGRAASTGIRVELVRSAQDHIKHVVFILKENRTFDTLFGRFPGADGTTTGVLCNGTTVPLKPAADQAANIDHSFIAGVTAVNGGKMNCFDHLGGGGMPPLLGGYVQYSQAQIPNYWSYAQHFALADHFFSSVFGPSGIEHLWTFAAGSGGLVGHEGPGQFGTGAPREYCDDPAERAWAFRTLTKADRSRITSLESSQTTSYLIRNYWVERWPCVNIPVLPTSSRRGTSRGWSTAETTHTSSRFGWSSTFGGIQTCGRTSCRRTGSSPTSRREGCRRSRGSRRLGRTPSIPR
jgi:hypothetical protein